MVEVEVYADISVTGTTFERPEFDRMIQDIRVGRINTVITRDLSRLGRNYVEAGNYIERVFPFLDVRYIAITDDFDTARPGTDLSVPLKNIVNEYYSKDLSKKVETGKHSIWAQGGFSEGTSPYGYYRATDGSRKLLIDEEVSDNVVRIFNMFLDGEGYGSIAKTVQSEGILSPPKYRFYKAGKTEFAEKAREWHYSHVKEILQGEYYIGNIVHGKQRKALDMGRKNKKTDKSKWQRVENAHESIIDKDTFYRVQERIELIRSKHLEGLKPNPEAPKKPDNILVYKTKCACCGGSVLIIRHYTYSDRFMYKCSKRRKLTALCENKSSYEYNEVMDSVLSVIRQHMNLCIEKTKFVQKMNSRKENILQYDIYTKQIAKLQNDVRRITANKSGLYEDYREHLITAEELCQYQKEYESRVNEIEAQITELLYRRSLYEKDFHIDEGWEETVNKYLSKRKLTRELVEAFVSEIVFTDNNIEVKLLYDDFLKELLEVAEEREVGSNGYNSIFEHYQKLGVRRCYERYIGEHMWSASTVMGILYNEVYIGSVINNKTADNIDTGHQVVQRDKEDWIIVENCHEPLVSVEDFKLAHKMIARREKSPRKPNGTWRKSYLRCGVCGKGLNKYGNGSSYRCREGHVSRIRGEEIKQAVLDVDRKMALVRLKEFEIQMNKDSYSDDIGQEIESLKKAKAHYAKLKFEIYDDYTRTNITREQMAKKTAEVKNKIAELDRMIAEKQELFDLQKDLFVDAKQEQLTKLSKLDEFDEDVIRNIIDYVLIYDNEHIEIKWNFDDFHIE